MSGLTRFRDHCRRMSTAEHKPECPSLTAREPHWDAWILAEDGKSMTWRGPKPPWTPPTCDGCLTDADRALFERLADEVDAYSGGAR